MSQPIDPRRPAKSEAAFRTIGEVAEELGVPQHVLRFWETKFSQIRPMKRGGGRRYYRPEDVTLLRRIRTLLYGDGFTIKGAQKLLRKGATKSVSEAAAGSVASSTLSPLPSVGDTVQGDFVSVLESRARDGSLNGAERAEVQAVIHELMAVRDLLQSVRGTC